MPTDVVAGDRSESQTTFAGLDALDLAPAPPVCRARRIWAATWPKVAAVVLAILVWQVVVWTHWKKPYQLPPPSRVWPVLRDGIADGSITTAVRLTMDRAVRGFALSIVIGGVIGAAVARSKVLRSAIGSFITGLQTMPSVAWYPLAILLFGGGEKTIAFVVVMGAAPSIANGVINGVDTVSPLLLRAGRVLGAKGVSAWRHVIIPAATPSFLGGLKQGWAFMWRSLLAGELIVTTHGANAVGNQLDLARQFNDADGLLAMMIVILAIGIVVDAVFFGGAERWVRKRWGLAQP